MGYEENLLTVQFDCCEAVKSPQGWDIDKCFFVNSRAIYNPCDGEKTPPPRKLCKKKARLAVFECDDLRVEYKVKVDRVGNPSLCFVGALRVTNDSQEPTDGLSITARFVLCKDGQEDDSWLLPIEGIELSYPVLDPGESHVYAVCGCVDITPEREECLHTATKFFLKALVTTNAPSEDRACCELEFNRYGCRDSVKIVDKNDVKGKKVLYTQPETTYEYTYTHEEICQVIGRDECFGRICNVAKIIREDCGQCKSPLVEAMSLGAGDEMSKLSTLPENGRELLCDGGGCCDRRCRVLDSSKACIKVAKRKPRLRGDCRTHCSEHWRISKCAKRLPKGKCTRCCDWDICEDVIFSTRDEGPSDGSDPLAKYDLKLKDGRGHNPKDRVRYRLLAKKICDDCVVDYRYKIFWDDIDCPIPKYVKKFVLKVSIKQEGHKTCSADDVCVSSEDFRCKPFKGNGCFTNVKTNGKIVFRLCWDPEIYNLCRNDTEPKDDERCYVEFCKEYTLKRPVIKLSDKLRLRQTYGCAPLVLKKFCSSVPVDGTLVENGLPTPDGYCVDLTGQCEFHAEYTIVIGKCDGKVILENRAELTNTTTHCVHGKGIEIENQSLCATTKSVFSRKKRKMSPHPSPRPVASRGARGLDESD